MITIKIFTDIPGMGSAKAKTLNSAGILTIKDLINCNEKILAQQLKGIGVASLNKWKQAARQLLQQ
ncbi:MAG: helix-hairpin-helix domain-containing protein [Promethearchaeota archaeon]